MQLLFYMQKISPYIIHIKLLEYYSFSTISNYDINLVCHAVENLINMFGYSFL